MGRLNRRVERLKARARAAAPDEGELQAAAFERLSNQDLDTIEAFAKRSPAPGTDERSRTPRASTRRMPSSASSTTWKPCAAGARDTPPRRKETRLGYRRRCGSLHGIARLPSARPLTGVEDRGRGKTPSRGRGYVREVNQPPSSSSTSSLNSRSSSRRAILTLRWVSLRT